MKTPNHTQPGMFDEKRKLCCPSCGSTELASTESILGSCASTFYVDGEVEGGGYTEMAWDSSESIGVECKACYWDALDKDQPEGKTANHLLVPQGFECDFCGEPVDFVGDEWVHTGPVSVGLTTVPGSFECDPLDPDDDGVATPTLRD